MNLKNNIVLTLTLLATPLAADFLDDYENREPHFLEFLDETPDEQFDLLNDFMPQTSSLRALDPCLIVSILVNVLNAVKILKQDFFLSTNRPARRSLLDMPLFQPNKAV